jgi:hypothetical protein
MQRSYFCFVAFLAIVAVAAATTLKGPGRRPLTQFVDETRFKPLTPSKISGIWFSEVIYGVRGQKSVN